jgi:hypothetical protein
MSALQKLVETVEDTWDYDFVTGEPIDVAGMKIHILAECATEQDAENLIRKCECRYPYPEMNVLTGRCLQCNRLVKI